jgi:sodium-dependent phosphate cotransporter
MSAEPAFVDPDKDAPKQPEEVKSRQDRATGSTHFGDVDFYDEQPDEIADASWGEVCTACCVHSPAEWFQIFIGFTGVLFFLYFFLLGLELLGSSAKVIGGCAAGSLFGDDFNPISGLMIGILCTVLLQSSSTTTSIIVSLVGADSLTVDQAIYMIMGANIGTTVTNTIVAMGQMGDGDQLERAFAGATVHDIFNYLTVLIFLPLEAATHYLYYLTKAMLPATVGKGDKWKGPLKIIVSPLGNRIIKANKKVVTKIATGDAANCDEFYPSYCTDGIVDYKHCKKVGLIECDKSSGTCPAFFQNGAYQKDDEVSGGVCLFLALVILVICLMGLITLLQKMLLGMSTRIIYKATNINPYIAMLIGMGLTILVQSSSITTSALTPIVGMGVIQLEQMLPLTLGANIGTTFTAILASLVSSSVNALQVSLCHLFFNLSGIIVWYPIPFMRNIVLKGARILGKATRIWRLFPLLWIGVMFFALPLIFLGISSLFEQKKKGFTVLASVIVVGLGLAIMYGMFWWKYRNGAESCTTCMKERQRKSEVMKSLPDDMEYLKSEITRLREHTGLPDDIEMAKELDTNEQEESE